MSVAVKTRHINRYHFNFRKSTPRKVIAEISRRYSAYLIDEPDNEPIDIITTDWYKKIDKEMQPKDYLRHLREACAMTQRDVGEKIGINAAHVSDFETGQRAISKNIAKKLSEVFNTSPAVFI